MKRKSVLVLHKIHRGLWKIGLFALSVLLLYRGLLWTLPAISAQLSTVTVVSAGLSFLDGGVALAQHEIQAEDSDLYTSHAQQEDLLSDTPLEPENETTTSEETTPSTPESTTDAPAFFTDDLSNLPERPENAGSIVRKTLTAGTSSQFIPLTNGFVKNLSPLSKDEVLNLSNAGLPFTVDNLSEPQVLIYHTHATESYQDYYTDWYNPSDGFRSSNNEKNMVAVGDVLAKKLESQGIGVIHDTTQHDNPSYTGAYDRSRVTIQKYLEEYPSIKVILDVHRDAIQGDNFITTPATEINGVKTSQIMLISCCDNGTDRIPNYRQNFSFASALQKQMEADYPTLTRPILFDDRFYNQDLSTGAVLIEFGDHGNTLNEAKNAALFLGDSLSKVLKASKP